MIAPPVSITRPEMVPVAWANTEIVEAANNAVRHINLKLAGSILPPSPLWMKHELPKPASTLARAALWPFNVRANTSPGESSFASVNQRCKIRVSL